ncbi:F-box/LRR-repeat protein 3 [Dorcoceras hygrometricum]|uniref:F-box/LRR-repeat protein 3 n=1 Tax=Dorcoceras hygrometricum TaxID=472368 RepID=A0A2Z6ZTY7_9LAMI|nr:F-box/LRR-repeat protein 3 [Dorcoceras hygrometricum]
MNIGRTLAACLPREERPRDAASGAKGCASKRAARSTMAKRRCPMRCDDGGRDVVRWPRIGRTTPLLSPRAIWRAVGRPLKHACRRCATLYGAAWSTLHVRRCVALRAMVRSCRREFLWWRRRRRRPPLRRVSGDVVTAGLISSRVWFGPIPGSP